MKISFLIPAMVLCIVRVSFCYDIRVGTVLFTKTDLVRKCWTESDKALLRARLIMQDVLPDPVCIDFSKPRAVAIILDYIYACFHIVRTSTYGKVQNLMYLALADAVGGYLRAHILPLAKKSYYAGLMTYDDACRVFALYDEIRSFLKTNGRGWTQPQKVVLKKLRVSPLEIVGGDPDACKMLYTIEKKGKIHCINAKRPPKRQKKPKHEVEESTVEIDEKDFSKIFELPESSPLPAITSPPETTSTVTGATIPTHKICTQTPTTEPKELEADTVSYVSDTETTTEEKVVSSTGNLSEKRKIGNETTESPCKRRKVRCNCCEKCQKKKTTKVKSTKRVIIPLPMIDDECDPHTIAVPFRTQPLRNLWKKTSAFVLEHYYVAVLQCFLGKGSTRADIRNFNSQFHSWLNSKVYPHLEDEQWYPAFGGVLRVRETIKRFGMEPRLNDPMAHDIAFMFEKGVGFDYEETQDKSAYFPAAKEKPREIGSLEYFYPTKTRFYYALAILAAAFVWFVTFCICSYLCLKGKNNSPESGKPAKLKSHTDVPAIPSQDCGTPLQEKRGVSFQFLVRFFKKDEGCSGRQNENPNECSDRKKLLGDSKTLEKKESQKRLLCKMKENEQTPLSKGGSARYLISEERKPQTPSWCCVTEKFEMPKRVKKSSGKGHACESAAPAGGAPDQQVKTLWKNPFLWPANVNNNTGFDYKKKGWFKFDSKKKNVGATPSGSITGSTNDSKSSSNKRTSSYSCSEGCPNSCTSLTNCTSRTHLKEKCSSATMEFFENVISRHKPTKKCFKQKSPTETETEDDSYSSENEY